MICPARSDRRGYGLITDVAPDEPAAPPWGMVGNVDVRVYAELNDFLPAAARGVTVRRPFRHHQTVKDVLEAMGVPHTEIDLILVNEAPVGFTHRPAVGDRIAAYPVFEAFDIGSTARLLRLCGFDVRFSPDAGDAVLAETSRREQRILLTRDRGLLKRSAVTHGLFVRSDRPRQQVVEVLRRLDLGARITPFTRCLRCGGAAGGGWQGGGDRPTAAADPALLRRVQPMRRMRSNLLGRFALHAVGRGGGGVAAACLTCIHSLPARDACG